LVRPHSPLSRTRLTKTPDITVPHHLHHSHFKTFIAPFLEAGSPLAEWTSAFLTATFIKLLSLYSAAGSKHNPANGSSSNPSNDVGLSLHDPLCIWYLLAQQTPTPLTLTPTAEDVRIETTGQWTRGACIVDGRNRIKTAPADVASSPAASVIPVSQIQSLLDMPPEIPGDTGNWLRDDMGNRVYVCVGSEWKGTFGMELLRRVFD
jgi:hypothetical protein